MIGLSLSLCIRDIIEGRVKLDDVEYIIAGTKCESNEDFEAVCEEYCEYYWDLNPRVAHAIASYLWNKKMILQPRVYGAEPPIPGYNNWRK